MKSRAFVVLVVFNGSVALMGCNMPEMKAHTSVTATYQLREMSLCININRPRVELHVGNITLDIRFRPSRLTLLYESERSFITSLLL